MTDNLVQYETDGGIAIITMNRPEVRNAMNTQMMTDLRDLFAGFYVDPDVAACLVLTGASGAFCSGGDLRERKGMTDATAVEARLTRAHSVVDRLDRLKVPTVAVIHGCELAPDMAHRPASTTLVT